MSKEREQRRNLHRSNRVDKEHRRLDLPLQPSTNHKLLDNARALCYRWVLDIQRPRKVLVDYNVQM